MNLSEQPLVSVVTPVYNGEKYLGECIESVLAQTYKNWEYIIVNNCSTDRSAEIITSYAKKDQHIIIYNNVEFVNAIENHHLAFRHISSKSRYCKVLHADDWLFPECIEKMVAVAEKYKSVGIVGAYRLEGLMVSLDGLPYQRHFVPGREICRSTLLGGPYVFGTPTSLLIRSDIIRKREKIYDGSNFSIAADTAACYEILKDFDFGFVHQVLTYTRRHQEAETRFAQSVNSYIGAKLLILKKYGLVYLSQEEYERCLEENLKKYYRFLARSRFQIHDMKFWKFHKKILEQLGLPFFSARFFKATCLELIDFILEPKRLITGIKRRISNLIKH